MYGSYINFTIFLYVTQATSIYACHVSRPEAIEKRFTMFLYCGTIVNRRV